MTSSRFHVQAHRGASAEYLENTLKAFERAIEVGADSIELDIHMTKDGEIVVYHDFKLDSRYCKDKSGKILESDRSIYSLTFEQIKEIEIQDERRIQVGYFQSISERRIPKLEDVFELFNKSKNAHAKEMLIDIEVKSDANHPEWSPSPLVFTKTLLNTVCRNWSLKKTILRSFDYRVLVEAKKLEPKLSIAVLTDSGFKDFNQVIQQLKPAILAPEKNSITKEEVEQVHLLGTKVIPYTVNEPSGWEQMFELGVDGVATDNPRALIDYLKSKGER